DMLVYGRGEYEHFIESESFEIIYMPIDQKAYSEYRNSNEFYFAGGYEEIFTNKNIFGWLKAQIKKQEYSFGIAEFNMFAAPFAIFDVLKIKNTFDVSSSIFYPKYLQFLDIKGDPIDVTEFQVPELNTSRPGDWKKGAEIWQKNSERYTLNIRNHLYQNIQTQAQLFASNSYFDEFAGNQPLVMYQLFKNIKLHFVNQQPLGIFKTIPEHEKIFYIGGIHVEDKNIFTRRNKNVDNEEPSCIVLATFGTVKPSGELTKEDVSAMFEQFHIQLGKNGDCVFKVRLDQSLLPENFSEKIQVTDQPLPQQELLSN
uniref:glucuronosyltransferase n=1 Tax=Meloidogyne floridensis TaxID=298350 RepID=A0A915NKC1_9BILA